MRPTTAFHANVFDINALLHPDAGAIFDHPTDVLANPSPVGFGKTRNPGVVGIRRISDRVQSRAAGAGTPQATRHR